MLYIRDQKFIFNKRFWVGGVGVPFDRNVEDNGAQRRYLQCWSKGKLHTIRKEDSVIAALNELEHQAQYVQMVDSELELLCCILSKTGGDENIPLYIEPK